MEFIQKTDLETRLRRLVAEDGEADLTGDGSDDGTLAFLLQRFWDRGFIRKENLPNIFENAIANKYWKKKKRRRKFRCDRNLFLGLKGVSRLLSGSGYGSGN